MDLDALIREADPACNAERVDVSSTEVQLLVRQIIDGRNSPKSGSHREAFRDWVDPGPKGTHRRYRSGVLVAAAVLAIAGIGATITLQSTGGPSRKHMASSVPRPMGWRLVSSNGPAMHAFASGGASPGGLQDLTCPTTQVCYQGSATGGGLPSNIAYRSVNGGVTWTSISLPPGLVQDTPFSCSSDTNCMVGAEKGLSSGIGASNVAQMVVSTGDGGSTWTTHDVPMPPIMGPDAALNQAISGLQGSLHQVTCFSSTSCMAFGTSPTGVAEGGSDGTNFVSLTVSMRTDDGGATWSTHVFPWSSTPSGGQGWSNQEHGTFTCPSQSSCTGLATVFGAPSASAPGTPGYGDQAASLLRLHTTDGGTTWTQNWVDGVQGGVWSLTCPDESHCFAVTEFGPAGSAGLVGVLSTSDGGATWEEQQPFASLNAGWNELSSISCPTNSTCWVAGSKESSSVPSESEGVVFATEDGGRTWVPVELPPGLGSVNQLTCGTTGSCLAIGQAPIPTGASPTSGTVPTLVLTNRTGTT